MITLLQCYIFDLPTWRPPGKKCSNSKYASGTSNIIQPFVQLKRNLRSKVSGWRCYTVENCPKGFQQGANQGTKIMKPPRMIQRFVCKQSEIRSISLCFGWFSKTVSGFTAPPMFVSFWTQGFCPTQSLISLPHVQMLSVLTFPRCCLKK